MNLIIILVIIIIIILIIMFLVMNKQIKNNQLLQHKIIELETQIREHNLYNEQQNNMRSSNLEQKIATANLDLDNKINNYNNKSLQLMQNTLNTLDQKMHQQAEVQNQQIKEMIERVSKLDTAQQQIMGLQDSISSLERTLNDKKARGTFGEIRLETILMNVFGANDSIWQRQFKLTNGTIVDFILHAPEPLGDLPIDSKFPLEGYNQILNASNEAELTKARRDFDQHVSKHLKDIHQKYIDTKNTASQAIMFIPSETIFSEIYAYHEKIIDLSYQLNVWICSPTTLMAILNLMLMILQDQKRSENALEIQKQLSALKIEFNRFATRWQTLNKDIKKIYDDAKNFEITTNKITNKFEKIHDGDLDD